MRKRISSTWMRTGLAFLSACCLVPFCVAQSGGQVVLIYNSKMPESKKVAEHYAEVRHVPAAQIFGFDLPVGEIISRADFREQLQNPLFKKLEAAKLIANPDSKLRYIALCYGVPLKIARDPNLKEEEAEALPTELKRNEASVDADLSLIPRKDSKLVLTGPIPNPFYAGTNTGALSPTNSILLITRLDGPTAEIALHLVDKAVQAEADGLWGRAYFDLRGLTNSSYKPGDDWIRASSQIVRRAGYETVVDDRPETFGANYPMSQIAFYAGWYDGNASGPFTRPNVEFMPGAIAYHLHSFNAITLRSTSNNWAGPLLAKGATATLGTVEEPYLEGTPDIGVFTRLLFMGATFGEAAFASQRWLSWQSVAIGDPLYRPFSMPPEARHADLVQKKSPLIEWSHLKIVNINLATGVKAAELAQYLQEEPITTNSAVLNEKLSDLFFIQGRFADAADAAVEALKLKTSPLQRLRLLTNAAKYTSVFRKREPEAYEFYKQILKEYPDYIEPGPFYQRLSSLARGLGKTEEAVEFEKLYQKAIGGGGTGK